MKKPRHRSPLVGRRSVFESLEYRRLLTVYSDLAATLVPGSLTAVQSSLNTALNTASKIPLLSQAMGGTLGNFQALQIVTDPVVANLKSALNTATDDATAKSAIASALNLNSTDVLITHPEGASTIEVELHLHRDAVAASVPAGFKLNLGLSGLPVNIGASTTGSINATIGYDYAFGIKYKNSSLLVDANTKVSDFSSSLPNNQLVVAASLKLSDDFAATATVGLLQAIIDNRSHASQLTASFSLDNLSLTTTPIIGVTGNANLNLHAAASFASTTDTNTGSTFTFPGIGTDLKVAWDLSPGGKPTVSYDNVGFELGSFLSSFVRPIIQNIQIFTQPLEPLLTVLTAPLPGLTDLSHLIGQGDVNLLGIAKAAAQEGAFGPGIDEAVELSALLLKITKDINSLETSTGSVIVPLGDFDLDTSGDANDVATSLINGTVDFDDLGKVGVDLATNLLKGIQSSNAVQSIEDLADKLHLGGVVRDELTQLGKRLSSLQTGGVKLNFPIIDDPKSVVFPLLLGHDGDFASFDANLDFSADESKIPTNYEVFGLGIEASGSVHVQGNLHVAYDTFGVREFFQELAAGKGAHPEDLLDGFYISDATPDKPQFALSGSISLGAGVTAGFFSFDVGGGVSTSNAGNNPRAISAEDADALVVNLHDANSSSDDGKLRLSKIGADPDDPGCVFDVGGQINAGAQVTVKVGVKTPLGFAGYKHTFDIATVTLVNLDPLNCLGKGGIPAANPPIIAGDPSTGMPVVDGTGTVTLFLGDNAGKRQNIPSTTDDAANPENWEVTHEAGDPNDTLTIKAFGVTQKVTGVTKIVAAGHLAAQTISIDEEVLADADVTGSDLEDQLTYRGKGTATLIRASVNDRLTVGPMSKTSTLHGGANDDILIGGGGDDSLFGDGGNDALFAGTRNQTLDGGADDDQLTAGAGADKLLGGTGKDLITWNVGNGVPITVDGGSDSNTLDVVGDSNSNSFTASASGSTISIGANLIVFHASNIQILSLEGAGGADGAIINNLAGTGVQEVHVNQSEEIAPDGAVDTATINASAGTNLLIDQYGGEVTPGIKGAAALVNGLPYKVFVSLSESKDSLTVNLGSSPTTVTIDMLAVDSLSGNPRPAAIPLPGQLTVNDPPTLNTYNVKSISGMTVINASGGNNIFNVGSNAPLSGGNLQGITAALTLNGSGGADVANIDDSGDLTGRSGTLTSNTLSGLGMGGAITYSGLSALNLNLGSGKDTFTITSTSCPSTIRGGGDDDMIKLQATAVVGPTYLYGDGGNDQLLVDKLPVGQVSGAVNLDGGNGTDTDTVNITGAGGYLVNVTDTGAESLADTLIVNGTDQADNFLLRASAPAVVNGVAFVAALHGNPVSLVERVNYTKGLKGIVLNLAAGSDAATMDDNWAPTTINGGLGNDHFQIGQIFKSQRDAAAGIGSQDAFETLQTTRGYLSNGASFATTIHGNENNDDFVVFHNKATLGLFGDDGDDTFTIRAFAAEGSTDTNVDGGKDVNLIQYVGNAKVNVDGGQGTDTLRIIGTEFADRVVLTKDGIFGIGLNVSYVAIEKLEVDLAEGDDEFYVLSTDPSVDVTLFGGLGSDLFSLAGDTPQVVSGTTTRPATVESHTVKFIQGALHINGAAGKGSTGGLGNPVMLPGETNTKPSDGKVLAFTGTGGSLSTDSMTVATAALQAALAREVPGSTNLANLVGKTLEVSGGPGSDRFWQITAVASGPTQSVLTLRSPGNPAAEWGLPNTTSDFTVSHLSANFFVSETDTLDALTVFNDGSTTASIGALSGTALTGLGMGASGATYAELETVEVLLGTGVDTFTVSGTATGAITAVHGGGGGDHLTITGGGGPTSPLLVYGDTTQDHSRYTSAGATPSPGAGFTFAVDGDDSIDGSADQQSVAIYGGGGQDVIFGSQVGDHLAGGAGDDEIHGQGGNDHIYGDSGFNQDLTTRLDRATNQILKVVTVETTRSDKLFGDSGDDIIFGDHGIITQTAGTQRILTTGSVIGVQTTNVTSGGDDEIQGGTDNDALLGGKGNDRIDGNAGQDLIFGDHAVLTGRALGVMTSPRFRALAGTQLYNATGNPQVTAVWQTPPSTLPTWANWLVTLVDGNFGNDYLAGGAGNDTLFGQSGDDTIQGDGAISLSVSATLPSMDDFAGATLDGDDYAEGGSGNDVILGNLGQDDLIGGNSDFFGFTTATQRADGADTIFGGSGTAIGRNDLGDVSQVGHARDADTILGDNGDIYRLVGTNGVATTAFLNFNYDNYGSAKIIPRIFQTLDYTPGAGSASDIGSNDILHGERGDDIIHGETGNDILFGEGQDDQIIGGAGQDRIYGGAGEDNLLGDDGRFIISRNGLTEPLYGVTTVNAQTDLTLPGPFTGAWEYITGRLNSSVHLLAPTLGGNDVIFGGLGDDFIHAGTGNDAASGAEAQAAWYNSIPVGAGYYSAGGFNIANQSDPLGYNAATRKLAAYDANNPLTKIPNFFLNFDATDITNNKIDDGKDRIFGDDGHDWMVGGTDNDRLFGGKGDDLINADDNLATNGGLNNQPDSPAFADRDFVYGGDGLDVMIANTGGDRMFDWGGEFNSYVVPFSPFGEPTVYRSPSPQIQQFLLALGKASGADQAMTEPNGELGLFTQQDPQWQSNHGAPRDPQPGNIGGTQRDTQGGPEDDRMTALPLRGAAAAPSGGSSVTINSSDVTLNTIIVSADPSNPSARALFVGGSNSADTILVRQGSSSAYLDVVINSVDKGQFAIASSSGAIGRIIVYGYDGNDSITINSNVQIEAVLYGEAGDDTLAGGGGNNVLDGGSGNDVLTGNGGRNFLIGGQGQDTLNGGKNSDLLIGGSYKYSADITSLWSLMGVWKGSGSYSQRVADLRTGGIDGLFAVNSLTVIDDKTVDFLYSNQDQDWYWVFGLDTTDKIKSGIIVN